MSSVEVASVMQLNDPQQRGNEKKALEVMKEAYPPAKELDDSRRSASQVSHFKGNGQKSSYTKLFLHHNQVKQS